MSECILSLVVKNLSADLRIICRRNEIRNEKHLVLLVLLLPPLLQLRLHHAEEVFLSSDDQLIGTLLSLLPTSLLVSTLLRSTPFLQTHLSLSSLQDLLSLRLALKHLQPTVVWIINGQL